MGEYNRFSKGLFGWVGFDTKWIEVENVERVAGETKWSFWKLLVYSIEGIVALSLIHIFLEQALTLPQLPGDKPIAVYLFSQGKKQDFPEFADFLNLHYCLDMGPIDSFLHMVNADLLITSKSSFSYKPALLNRGLKICPQNFWHGYPEDPNWILADDTGAILPH